VLSGDAGVSTLTAQASGSNVVVTWARSGGGAELAQAPTLLHSSDGINYNTVVGTMTRIANGWQMTAPYAFVGPTFYLKASGYVSGGSGNGSLGRVDSPVYSNDRIFANGFE